jgi:hypothetical protein
MPASSRAATCCRNCAPRPPEPGRDRAARQAQRLGDIAHAHLFELEQREHRTQRFVQAPEDVVKELSHLLAAGEELRRGDRLDALRRVSIHDLPPSRNLPPGVPRQVLGDLNQKAALRADLNVVDPLGRNNECPLDLVVEIGRRDARALERARHGIEVLVDQRADARMPVAWRGCRRTKPRIEGLGATGVWSRTRTRTTVLAGGVTLVIEPNADLTSHRTRRRRAYKTNVQSRQSRKPVQKSSRSFPDKASVLRPIELGVFIAPPYDGQDVIVAIEK